MTIIVYIIAMETLLLLKIFSFSFPFVKRITGYGILSGGAVVAAVYSLCRFKSICLFLFSLFSFLINHI